MLQTLDDLVDRLGGVTKLSNALGLPLGTVSAWKTRRSIPVDYWVPIIELAQQQGIRGISFKSMTLMHTGPETAAASR